MVKTKTVIFDIDTTLTYGTSWLTITKELGALVDTHNFIYKEFKENRLTYTDAKEQLLNLWKETGNNNKEFFEEIFNKIPFKIGAQEVIEYLKIKGILVCLITGSVDLYAKVIANRLKVDNYFANTELIWDEQGKLVDFNYDIKQSKKKLDQFLSFCSIKKINPTDCFVVGDDDNDVDLFKYTKKGIAVRSENFHVLKPHAWKVIDNLLEIKKFI